MQFRTLLVAMTFIAVSAHGQVRPSTPVIVLNPPTEPVPVIGTVDGAVHSADTNIVLHDGIIAVNTATFGNANVPLVDVSGYKEVRLVVERGSCGPCGDPIHVAVNVRGDNFQYQIDQFTVSTDGAGVGKFATRTYTVPGLAMLVALRANAGNTNNSVRVLLVGRSN